MRASKTLSALSWQPVGVVDSPYRQKFAIPRQPNLVPEVCGRIIFYPQFSDLNMLRQIEEFSHLWLLFYFHATAAKGWSPTVQPPRLGGKTRVGVFASRSPFRPNSIGMSVVKNRGYHQCDGKTVLEVGGLDLLDGTPIIDVKPYLPYADAITGATSGYAAPPPTAKLDVEFSPTARSQLESLQNSHPGLAAILESILGQDPRPAWRVKEGDSKQYGLSLYDLNIKWRLQGSHIEVLSVSRPLDGQSK